MRTFLFPDASALRAPIIFIFEKDCAATATSNASRAFFVYVDGVLLNGNWIVTISALSFRFGWPASMVIVCPRLINLFTFVATNLLCRFGWRDHSSRFKE